MKDDIKPPETRRETEQTSVRNRRLQVAECCEDTEDASTHPTHKEGAQSPRRRLRIRHLGRYFLFLCILASLVASLVVKFVDKKKWCRLAICYEETWQKPNSHLPCRPKNTSQPSSQNVTLLFGLSGNHPGVLSEFEVSLKSVLLNCPMQGSLDIYILVDDLAQKAVEDLADRIGLSNGTLTWWAPVNFRMYNVQDRMASWSQRFNPQIQQLLIYRHSFGSYFRLFAHEVLPKTVKHVLYMDTDVIIMANLVGLWQYLDKDVIFQWGKGRCAGFIFLNLERMPEIWPMMDEVDWHDYPSKNLDDQKLLRGIEMLQPNITGCIPKEWDFSFADSDGWSIKGDLYKKHPQVGMAHFNGVGGTSKGSIYEELSLFKKYPDSWGIFLYYVRLPWEWVQFFAESSMPGRGHKMGFIHAE